VELVVIFLLTIICFPVITLTDGIFRIILGIVFLLLFPGYTLTTALFPGKKSIGGIERVTLTLILSFALVALAGFILNYTPWGITLTSVYTAIAAIIIIDSGLSLFRRSALPKAERFSIQINFRTLKWSVDGKFNRALYIVLAVVVIGAISTLSYVIAHPKADEPFTNFYILGQEGNIGDYPQEVTLGEPAEVTLGIGNYENQDTSYRVIVTCNETAPEPIGPIFVVDKGTWSEKVTFAPANAGNNQRVEFALYKGEETVPYVVLHLWVDVK
jgi:uncharacterized membrane protein